VWADTAGRDCSIAPDARQQSMTSTPKDEPPVTARLALSTLLVPFLR
jgi:hypothetical protein